MADKKELTHLDENGKVKMVDVGQKEITHRQAKAFSKVFMDSRTLSLIKENKIKKGDVLTVAKIAGIFAAKQTSNLIPLCHPLSLSRVDLDLKINESEQAVEIISQVEANDRTGVEMEALTCAAIAALTIYDMCKSVNKKMVISEVKLLEKSGGKSGGWKRNQGKLITAETRSSQRKK